MFMPFVQIVAERLNAGLLAFEASDQQLIPAVQRDLVDAQNKILAQPRVAQCIGVATDQMQVFLAAGRQGVQANVDE